MKEYHKIQSIYMRDEETHKFRLGEYSRDEFKYLEKNLWDFTEKVDGMNIRIGWDCEEKTVRISGRTDNSQISADLYSKLYEKFTVDKFLALFPDTYLVLFGEGYGAGIQKGDKYSVSKEFVLFDVLAGNVYLSRDNVRDVAKQLETEVVPTLGMGTLNDMVGRAMYGFTSMWGEFRAEGIVARPIIELMDNRGNRIIVKAKYRDFN